MTLLKAIIGRDSQHHCDKQMWQAVPSFCPRRFFHEGRSASMLRVHALDMKTRALIPSSDPSSSDIASCFGSRPMALRKPPLSLIVKCGQKNRPKNGEKDRKKKRRARLNLNRGL